MPTISNIAIEESATVTGRVATVEFDRGGVTVDQEIMCLGDPDSSNAIAACSSVNPAADVIGLVTRPLPSTGFWRVQNSTASDFVSNVSSVAGRVLVDQNSTDWVTQCSSVAGRVLVDQNSTVWPVQVSSVAGTVGLASTQQVTVNHARTIQSVYTRVTSTNSTAFYSLIAGSASTNHRICAFSVTSTLAAPGLVEFISSTVTAVWGLQIGSASSGVTGANLAVAAPAWLFGTTGGGAAIQLRASQNAVYDVSLTYYSE